MPGLEVNPDFVSFCRSSAARANVGDVRIERWLADLAGFGGAAMVQAALASVEHSFQLLATAPWIIAKAAPLLHPSIAWLATPSRQRATECAQIVTKWEALADSAEALSTHQGDWWTFPTIEAVAMIPSAIALDAGTAIESTNWPLGIASSPASYLSKVCQHFAWFPSNVARTSQETIDAISQALLAWATTGQPVTEPLLALISEYRLAE